MATYFMMTQIQELANGYESKASSRKKMKFFIDRFGQEFPNSLGRDYLFLGPTPLKLSVPFQSPFQRQPISHKEIIGDRCPLKATKKRCFTEAAITRDKNSINLDLNLSLSPPGGVVQSPAKLPEPLESSRGSCMPLKINSSANSSPETSTIEEPSLILMGCKRCLIYVMVSEANPKCPKCKGSSLIDAFRQNFAEKSKNC